MEDERRALQIAAEVGLRRGPIKRPTAAVIQRAAETVSVKDAAEVAELHGHPILAWLLRRFVRELRDKPVTGAVTTKSATGE